MTVNNDGVITAGASSALVLPMMQTSSDSHTIKEGEHHVRKQKAAWRRTLPHIPESENNVSSATTMDEELSVSSFGSFDSNFSSSEEETITSAPTPTSNKGSLRWSLSRNPSLRGLGRPAFSRSKSRRSMQSNNPIASTSTPTGSPQIKVEQKPVTLPPVARQGNSSEIEDFSSSSNTELSLSGCAEDLSSSGKSIASAPTPTTRRSAPLRWSPSKSASVRDLGRPNPPARPTPRRSKSSRSIRPNPYTSNYSTPISCCNQIQAEQNPTKASVRRPKKIVASSPKHSAATSSCARNSEEFDFNLMFTVSTSWSKIIQSCPNYREILGEQVILKMMELDPRARSLLQFESVRSARFVELCLNMTKFIDAIVGFIGPDIDEYKNDIIQLGLEYYSSRTTGTVGIDQKLFHILTESVCAGIQYFLQDAFTDKTRKAWTLVLEFVVATMRDVVYV
jgi:hypothetical protein